MNNMAQNEVKEYFESGKQKKGLLLYGPNGTGKTTAMDLYLTKKWAGSSIDIANLVHKHGRGYLQKYAIHDMYIDDMGREPSTITSYGDNIELMHDLIFIRYQSFKLGYLTHISTNLDFNEISERYGVAISDRIKEMCNVISFCGESLRK